MNKLLCILYCAVNLGFIINPIFGFNTDLDSAEIINGGTGTMFGFSIALHNTHNNKSVIIGAPKATTHHFQPNIHEGGAVYRCFPNQLNNHCALIAFDREGNNRNDFGEQTDTKSYQWFGATVATGGDNGPVIACAPRYVFHTMEPRKQERIEPVGTCFTSSPDFTSFTQFSPCRTKNYGYHKQGSCQAGFSAAISRNNDRLFIGAPGSWYWQGRVFSINPQSRFPYKPIEYDEFGQMYSYDIIKPWDKVYFTGEGNPSDDDSYLGYSMVTGYFNKMRNGPEDIAVGKPRGGGLNGEVVIFRWNITDPIFIYGKQLGEYFGYSLCVVDVNGDGLDDLLIGAPMHAEENNANKYDVGRVYIMLQGSGVEPFSNFKHRDGVKTKGRFGLALTKLGDMNQDGFEDFAVGAPYDGPEGRGAVYVYHGSKDGPLKKPSQIIFAEDFKIKLSTFGFSLAGGMDLDNNRYPDFVVGAYGADSVVILRSRPIANVIASTKFQSTSKLINLDEKNCTLQNKARVSCANYISCIKYNGLNLPQSLQFEISWTLDAKKLKDPRMFLLRNEGKNHKKIIITLYQDKEECFSDSVYIKYNAGDIQDKLTPLEVEMSYLPIVHRRDKRELDPIIDQNKETVQRDSINILKNCGPDDVCIPDLKLKTMFPETFIIGSKIPFEIDVSVPNNGEDAFETALYMSIPEGLDFKNIKQAEDSRDITITCSETESVLKCNLGNPLPANRNANFKILLTPTQSQNTFDISSPSVEFLMEVNSTNPELSGSKFDNLERKIIYKSVYAELAIYGTSQPETEIYKRSDYKNLSQSTKETEVGPSILHIYNIRNNGPATIKEAVVVIHWPYKTNSGDDLMYLMTEPETVGNIKCEPSRFINIKNLEIEKNTTSVKHRLKVIGAVENNVANENFMNVTRTVSTGTSTSKNLTREEKKALEANTLEPSLGDSSQQREDRLRANTNIDYTENRTDYKVPSQNLHSNNHPSTQSHYTEQEHHPSTQTHYTQQQYLPSTQGHHTEQQYSQNQNKFSSSQNPGNSHFSSSSYQKYPSKYDESPDYGLQSNHLVEGQPIYTNQHHYQHRSKRDATEALCQRVQCVTIKCVAKNLNVNDDVYIAMRMRLVVETLEKIAENTAINMSTMAIARVTEFPFIGIPKKPIIESHEIKFQAIPESSLGSGMVPLWVVILSAVAGTIILLLLIFLLYTCGFFKRNRPSSNSHAQERQPLNRNGYHGDEHL